ncbi:MAG: potassium-transporting ATPase subunit C [Thermoplasmata archaeon]
MSTPPSASFPQSVGSPESARPPSAHGMGTHVRATLVLIVLTILIGGGVYPIAVYAIGQVVNPYGADGSLLTAPNGTVVGSSLIAQNTSAPWLFWERPSATDYNTTLGTTFPYGYDDPELAALFNETIQYMREYGNNTTTVIPFSYASPSASSVDPDLAPEAVLVQVPRVSLATNLSIAFLQNFVNAAIDNPPLPFLGVAYVDVLQLDLNLLPLIGR